MPYWLRAVRVPLGERPERTDVHTCHDNQTVSFHLVLRTMDSFLFVSGYLTRRFRRL